MGKFAASSFQAWILLLQLTLPVVSGVISPKASLLDLSYKHYLEPSVFEEVIRASLWDLEGAERPNSLQVDISCSVLGNEAGMKGILHALLPTEPSADAPVELHLSSRKNQVTPKIMDGLFQLLLSANNNNITTSNNTAANTTTENGSVVEGANATSGNGTAANIIIDATESATITSPERLRPWIMNTLDVGWNELQPNVPGWKSFLKSLQKLLQSRDLCPQTICLDRCGLGPGACRAIGKVRLACATFCVV